MKLEIKKYLHGERAVFVILALFVFFNWLILVNIEKLASPDYYKFYYASQNLLSGNLQIRLIPPLFLFLLGLLGKLIGILGYGGDAYILAGRTISLCSGLGVVWFTYLLLKKFVGQVAFLGTMLLAISPIFLKLLSLPQTDVLFLFFVVAAFYYFSSDHFKLTNLWTLLGAILTRFEGVLLIICAVVNFINKKKRFWFYLTASLAAGYGVLHLFFPKISWTLIRKIEFVFSHKYHLYYLKNPHQLVYLVYDNLLYFVSPSLPGFFKWLLFCLFVTFFTAGAYYLFKEHRFFAISLLFYVFAFIIFKGYMSGVTATQASRRFLSPLWIIFLVAFIGVYYLFKRIRSNQRIYLVARVTTYFVLVVLSLFLVSMKGKTFFLLPLLLLILLFVVSRLPFGRVEAGICLLILLFFTGQSYYKAAKISARYVAASANKACYAIAQWLNQKGDVKKIALLSNGLMIKYYLKPKCPIPHRFTFKEKNPNMEDKALLNHFRDELVSRKVEYLIFDTYLNTQDRPWEAVIKRWLYKQRRSQTYFRLKKILFYKGKAVAFVMQPKYEKFVSGQTDVL